MKFCCIASDINFRLPVAGAAVLLALSAAAGAETVKTVNGAEIDSTVLDVYMENRVNKPLDQVTEAERQSMLSELTDIYILSTQDKAEKLQDDPRVKAQIELQKRGVLAQAVASDFLTDAQISEEEIQAAYAEQVKLAPTMQYKARHILVPTQGVAEDVIKRLDDGADFEELAKEKSTGPSSPNGGDLGWFSPNQMVEPFSNAVAKLDDGEYTKSPVQTDFGWHVILREDSRDQEPPPLDNVRPAITQNIQQQKFQDHLQKLREEADSSD